MDSVYQNGASQTFLNRVILLFFSSVVFREYQTVILKMCLYYFQILNVDLKLDFERDEIIY